MKFSEFRRDVSCIIFGFVLALGSWCHAEVYSFVASALNSTVLFNGTTSITSSTADGSDTAIIKIAAGGAASAPSRGAGADFNGNETANGRLYLFSGNGGSSDAIIDSPVFYFRSAAGAIRWTIGDTLIGTGTASIGWTIQSAANQACNTTCVTPCVFGQETTSKAILSCSDATADSCLCAGAS